MNPVHQDDVVVPPLRVGLVGYGAIGSFVGDALRCGKIDGAELTGVYGSRNAPGELAVADLDALLDNCDLVVEAAGPAKLVEVVPQALERGITVVAVSTGAFLDDQLRHWLEPKPGLGQLILSTGAIGGLDLVRAARAGSDRLEITLRSTKRPKALVQSWMSDAEAERLNTMTALDGPFEVFSGDAQSAARLFPANLNVAATLAIAAGDSATVHIELVADETAEQTRHEVSVSSDIGDYHLRFENKPTEDNPATSGLVRYAVLRCLTDAAGRSGAVFR